MGRFRKWLPWIPLGLAAGVLLWSQWGSIRKNGKNAPSPRDPSAIYFYRTADSVYQVRYIVDSAWEREYDPPEDPRSR